MVAQATRISSTIGSVPQCKWAQWSHVEQVWRTRRDRWFAYLPQSELVCFASVIAERRLLTADVPGGGRFTWMLLWHKSGLMIDRSVSLPKFLSKKSVS